MEDEKSKVDKLSDTLYSRTSYKDPQDLRSSVRDIDTPEVKQNWESPSLTELLSHERTLPEVKPFMKKVFVFALFFFVAAILVAGFVFWGGVNFISSKNVDIKVTGPSSISAGEVLDLTVAISNENNSDLEPAFFSVQYPSGSKDPLDSSKSLTYQKIDLKKVKAGDEMVNNVRMVLIGSPEEVKEIKFSVEYKVSGSSATFYKDKIYEVTIGDAPVSLRIETPSSISSGDVFTTKLSVTLNSTEILKNVMLKTEYPYGFSVTGTSPPALADNNVWSLGDLVPGNTKNIEIQGKLQGENKDERTFRFYIGVGDNGVINPNFKTVILSTQRTIEIERPSVALNVSFNADTGSVYTAPAGRTVSTNVRFQNNLPEKLINPKLEARLSGTALNKVSMIVQNGGIYNMNTNRINWTLTSPQGLKEINPGENGSVLFSFASVPEALITGSREITLQFILTGTMGGDLRPITVSETRTIKVASQITLFSKALYSTGPFENAGPIPPKAGQPTTYSILWSVSNTQNDLNDAKVTAKLGNNVRWVKANEDSESVSYDEAARTVTWNLGGVASGVGFSEPERAAAIQVELTPTLAQVGTVPNLLTNIVFSAFDTVQNKDISITSSALNTRLTNDPAFIQGDDVVIK